MLNITQRIARQHENERTANSDVLNKIYNAVTKRALEIITSADGDYDDYTVGYARDLLGVIARIKRGEGSAQDHGRVARAYSAMRQGGLAD